VRKSLATWISLAVLTVGAFAFPRVLSAADDLNKEFVENFFKLRPDDADVFLKIQKSGAKSGTEAALENPVSNTNAGSGSDENDPSWIGKFLQLSILGLLGLVIYLMSRRSRSRARY